MRISDWSSDVCSSDLVRPGVGHRQHPPRGIIELKVGKHSVPVGDCLIFVAGGVIAMLFIILGRLLARFLAALDQILARSEEHTSELQSLMRISYAVFCLKKKNNYIHKQYKHVTKTQTHSKQHYTKHISKKIVS